MLKWRIFSIKTLDSKLERILRNVQKPAHYTGGEYNQIVKDKSEVDVRIAFCFPDTYEIGMSNLGLRILYGLLNGIDGVWCERVFAPWTDMEEQMRSNNVLLYGLESGDPIRNFDIVAFSLGYELSYTNVLNMLDLAGIPLRSADRPDESPLVIAGGMCCFNPEPMADFIDFFVIGEGEEAAGEVIDILRNSEFGIRNSVLRGCRQDRKATESKISSETNSKNRSGNGNKISSKKEFLEAVSKLGGVYVPSLYDIHYNDNGIIDKITPHNGASFPVLKRIVQNLDDSYFPVDTIVPSTGLVHDRTVLELFRGCIRGCRFCQAGYVCRPVRSRSWETLVIQGIEALVNSGYDELALLSLSTSDYKQLFELCDGLLEWCDQRKISLSLPSLRADNFSIELMERVQRVRKSGLTFAPEAGSQRLRDVINKNVTEDDLLRACRIAFEGGWNSVKLYFMLGLPSETDEDVIAIADLSWAVLQTWKQYARNKNRGVRITVSTSCFIPKPHTPFQWAEQVTTDEYLRRVTLLRSKLRSKTITYNWHSPEQGLIEAALSRADRRVGSVIEAAWRLGARLDSWSEYFSLERWLTAFVESGLDPAFYAQRERDQHEILPWCVVSTGIDDEHLQEELIASRENRKTPDCREGCSGCGASNLLKGAQCSE